MLVVNLCTDVRQEEAQDARAYLHLWVDTERPAVCSHCQNTILDGQVI